MEKLSIEKHQMVIENLNLVHWALKSMNVPVYSSNYEDYYQEGCIGLIHAVMRFDESKGFQFATFAVPYIRGTIQRYRREKGNIIRVQKTDYDRICVKYLTKSHGRDS